MVLNDVNNAHNPVAVSDWTLRSIVEQGFFGSPGSLADARSACAELIFARAVIEAQTAKLMQLSKRERARGAQEETEFSI